ncbi:MAG: sigma-70 family RNA polymerase sigma factor [Phycisphaerae bacterium]
MNPIPRLREELLILRCQGGDESAFEQVIQRYHDPLRYFVRRLIGDIFRADDIVQEVWLSVYRKLRTLERPEAFQVWLYRIARNQAYQYLKKEKRLPSVLQEEDVPTVGEYTVDAFSAEDAAQIHQGLEKLPLEQREVLVLRFLEEMEYQEIAEVIGCSIGTVRSRIFYAKRSLRRAMEDLSHDR